MVTPADNGGLMGAQVSRENKTEKTMRQIIADLLRLGSPLSVAFILQSSLQLVTVAFAGKLGDAQLAVAGLGQQLSLVAGLGIVFMASADGLSTLATQAYGANRIDLLPGIWQRAILFNALHFIPIGALLISIPSLFHAMGRSPEFTQLLRHFLVLALPLIPMQGILYPLNFILVAQGHSVPIMWMSGLAFVSHIIFSQLLVISWGLGLTGSALSLCLTYLLMILFLVVHIACTGLGNRVWGNRLVRHTWHEIREYAALGYSSLGMRAVEFYAYTYLTILAGFLPSPEVTQAAAAVAIEITGILFVPFLGLSIATTTLVGNELGSNNPTGARKVARTGPIVYPFVLAIIAVVGLLPYTREFAIDLLAKSGSMELRTALNWVIQWIVLHMAFDGMQSLLGGVLTGAGLQKLGFRVNLVVFPLITMPLVFVMGKMLGLGLRGLFFAQIIAPIIQTTVFGLIIGQLDWKQLAARAQQRAQVVDQGLESGLGEPLLTEKGGEHERQ